MIAATDYIRAFAEQIRAYVPRRYVVLGTDGFGRSDTREKLRRFFEVNAESIVTAALSRLARDGVVDMAIASRAFEELGVSTEKPDPATY